MAKKKPRLPAINKKYAFKKLGVTSIMELSRLMKMQPRSVYRMLAGNGSWKDRERFLKMIHMTEEELEKDGAFNG